MSENIQAQPQRVNVINPYGEPENIDAAELKHAIGVGYKVATPEEVQDFKLQHPCKSLISFLIP